MTQKTVKFTAQERLDLIDANALQSLVYDYMNEVGGLFSAAGCINPFSVAYSISGGTVYNATLSAFSYVTRVRSLSRSNPAGSSIPATWKSKVVHFDPSEESTEVVDYTAARTAANADYTSANPNTDDNGQTVTGYEASNRFPTNPSALPMLLARVVEVDEDSDTRRRWDVPGAAEVSYTSLRRTALRTEFSWADSQAYPTSTSEWVVVGKIVGWLESGGVLGEPVLRPLYVWDDQLIYSSYTFDWSYEDSNPYGVNGDELADTGAVPFSVGHQFGLSHMLFMLRRAMQRQANIGRYDGAAYERRHWDTQPDHSTHAQAQVTPKAIVTATRDPASTDYTITAEIIGRDPVSYSKTANAAAAEAHTLELDAVDLVAAGLLSADVNTYIVGGRPVTDLDFSIASPGSGAKWFDQIWNRKNTSTGDWEFNVRFKGDVTAYEGVAVPRITWDVVGETNWDSYTLTVLFY